MPSCATRRTGQHGPSWTRRFAGRLPVLASPRLGHAGQRRDADRHPGHRPPLTGRRRAAGSVGIRHPQPGNVRCAARIFLSAAGPKLEPLGPAASGSPTAAAASPGATRHLRRRKPPASPFGSSPRPPLPSGCEHGGRDLEALEIVEGDSVEAGAGGPDGGEPVASTCTVSDLWFFPAANPFTVTGTRTLACALPALSRDRFGGEAHHGGGDGGDNGAYSEANLQLAWTLPPSPPRCLHEAVAQAPAPPTW